MEYMEGVALTDVIDNNPSITEDQISTICLRPHPVLHPNSLRGSSDVQEPRSKPIYYKTYGETNRSTTTKLGARPSQSTIIHKVLDLSAREYPLTLADGLHSTTVPELQNARLPRLLPVLQLLVLRMNQTEDYQYQGGDPEALSVGFRYMKATDHAEASGGDSEYFNCPLLETIHPQSIWVK
ncbi:hypothetical protein VTL71DRAFT_15883 [Oculimacula yallundae]|uniref:Uncharacterized protein n=1 Tax=Oculimacula yallundae TaxID=86028 RepID=A0ABR4CE49_9HELO